MKKIGRPAPDGTRGYGTFYSVGSSGGLRGRKRSLFEGGVRVPLFVRWPGHTPAEYQAGLKGQDDLEARFKNFDKNGDGKLTREEFVGASAK